jgi:membrane-associated phospholipid phosphatase
MRSSKSFIEKYFKKLSGKVILLLIAFAISVALFDFILHEVIWEKEDRADQLTFIFLSKHVITAQLTVFMKAVTYCASKNFLQVAYLIVVGAYLFRMDWKRAGEIIVIGLGGFLINYFMKLFFHRPRPPYPLMDPLQNFSFPSGHATSGFIFYGLLAFLVWKTKWDDRIRHSLIAVLIFFALLIGFSRIYLRMHYLSDVVAGLAIGVAWLVLCISFMETTKKKTHNEIVGKSKVKN